MLHGCHLISFFTGLGIYAYLQHCSQSQNLGRNVHNIDQETETLYIPQHSYEFQLLELIEDLIPDIGTALLTKIAWPG